MIISHKHLLTLCGIKGFGPKKIHTIVEYLHDEGFSNLSDREMCDIISELMRKKVLKGVREFDLSTFFLAAEKAKRVLEKTMESGIRMVSRYDESYPKILLNTVNEEGKEAIPLYLFYRGDLSVASRKSVAIIGTREPSSEGEMASRYFAKTLAKKGINIVSGLAIGCDTAAHKGAIEVQGTTIAALGGGLDNVYPPENLELANAIVETGGLLISEYPIGVETSPYFLVARDRLQATLSQAVLVIQTDVDGGTLHAVKAASVVGKPIFAVEYKNNLDSKYVGGNQHLIQTRMAKPVTSSPEDITSIISCMEEGQDLQLENSQLSLF